MTRQKILQGIAGWSISSGIIIVVALTAIQIQFGGSLASFSYIAASLGVHSYLIGSLMFFTFYWICSVIFGKGEILKIFKANILLAIALVMFCIVIVDYVFKWLPTQMTNCIDLPTGIERCSVNNFWFQAIDYGSLILVLASFAVRIVQSRKMAKVEA